MRTTIALFLLSLAFPAFAQSPNTASLVVTVADQTGASWPARG